MNFKSMAPDGNDGRPPGGNFSLARQPSVYSLTFDEFQNTLGGIGKDFGSMNMDELLKNIWSAEETQVMSSTGFGASECGATTGNLQRQGSLTLPRTLSQKTVDEVWRDLYKENGGKDVGGNSTTNFQQRQQTLGEMTLEEFLVRAGVVREDPQPIARPSNGGYHEELLHMSNNMGLGLGFPDRSNVIGANLVTENNSQIPSQPPNISFNFNGVRSSHQENPHVQSTQPQRQPLYPNQKTMSYAPSLQFSGNTEAANPVVNNGILGFGDSASNNGFVPGGGGGGMNMVGFGGTAKVGIDSPSQLSSDGLTKSNGDNSSLSPVPYVFNGGIRGRRSNGAVEKVVERRQRRMIKNRESAARSRARKQAYTMDLEAEVAKLKEENQALKRKQAVILEVQKKRLLENQQPEPKRRCLRRTHTGPW